MQEMRVQPLGPEDPPKEGNGKPLLWECILAYIILLYSCLGNPMDRGAWQTTVMVSQKSRTRLSDETTIADEHKFKNTQKN